MNQAYENIIERRSCKSYKEQRVAKEVFETEEGKELLKKWGLEEYEGIGNCILGYSDGEITPRKPRTSKVVWE